MNHWASGSALVALQGQRRLPRNKTASPSGTQWRTNSLFVYSGTVEQSIYDYKRFMIHDITDTDPLGSPYKARVACFGTDLVDPKRCPCAGMQRSVRKSEIKNPAVLVVSGQRTVPVVLVPHATQLTKLWLAFSIFHFLPGAPVFFLHGGDCWGTNFAGGRFWGPDQSNPPQGMAISPQVLNLHCSLHVVDSALTLVTTFWKDCPVSNAHCRSQDEVYFGLGTPGTLEKPLPTARTPSTHRVSVAR